MSRNCEGTLAGTIAAITVESTGFSDAITGTVTASIGEFSIWFYAAVYDFDKVRNKPFQSRVRPGLIIRPWRTGW